MYLCSDNLRELCNTFRHLLYELAKCVSVCEHDLNVSLIDELNHFGILQNVVGADANVSRPASPLEVSALNQSTASSLGSPSKRGMRVAVVPDVSGILSLIEDPSLVHFVTEISQQEECQAADLDGTMFNLNSCLEKLKSEADALLQLSEKIVQKRFQDNRDAEQNASFEGDDGLKSKKALNSSLNNSSVARGDDAQRKRHSLSFGERKNGTHSELNEMKNQLIKADQQREELETKLTRSMADQNRLTEELRLANIKLNSFVDGRSEELSEG